MMYLGREILKYLSQFVENKEEKKGVFEEEGMQKGDWEEGFGERKKRVCPWAYTL